MPNTGDDLQQYYARDRQEWRAWLEANASTSPGVWLIWVLKHYCA